MTTALKVILLSVLTMFITCKPAPKKAYSDENQEITGTNAAIPQPPPPSHMDGFMRFRSSHAIPNNITSTSTEEIGQKLKGQTGRQARSANGYYPADNGMQTALIMQMISQQQQNRNTHGSGNCSTGNAGGIDMSAVMPILLQTMQNQGMQRGNWS